MHPTHLTTSRINLRSTLTVTGRHQLTRREALIGGVICWLFGFASSAWFVAYVVIQIPAP